MRTPRADATPPSGLRVGAYRLLDRIGEGGMGVVHLAQGPDGRRVALKVLRPHIVGDGEGRERLAREVASLRRVRSPRIAEILDADPWGDTPFVATRYVPGLSLHEHVRQEGPLSGEDLRYFAAGLAEALLAVHSVGVLHRDVKPSNVLLEGRAPVLIDFGLARLADDPRLTVTGWLLGTPGYLAPEILYGDDATTASDVHAWAATVAFAATGRPPFGTGPAMAVMDRVRRGEHDLSTLPSEIAPLVRAALAPDPSARPTLPTVLADLRPRPDRRGRSAPEPTMPLVVASRRQDDDPTDLLPPDRHAAQLDEVRTVAETVVDGRPPSGAAPAAPPTTPYTTFQPDRGPLAGAPVTTPYTTVQPQGPAASRPGVPGEPPDDWRPPPGGAARVQRGLLLGGLFALVAVGFALAPYLATVSLAAGALVLRTWSWTAEAAGERVRRRGRRWYDVPLGALSAPWYLLVATGGTVMLVLWSVALAFLVGLGLLLFRLPLEGGLLVMGAVLAFSTWWGPGGRRLRLPTRSLVLRTTGSPAVGWVGVVLVAAATALCGYLLTSTGTSWAPATGAPWRPGTPVGDLLRFL